MRMLSALPAVEQDIAAALAEHWGKDHVQQAVRGADVLAKVLSDVAAAQPPAPPSQMPAPLDPDLTELPGATIAGTSV